jgi:hypothetical protein
MTGDAVRGHEGTCFVAKNLTDLIRRPNKELALNALAVGILSAAKPSGRFDGTRS